MSQNQTSVPTKSTGNTFSAVEFNDVNDTLNANATDSQARLPAIVINSKSDLPTPSAGVITISDTDVRYLINGSISLGTDRLDVTGATVQFEGLTPDAGFLYTGTLALMSTSTSVHLTGINLIGMTATRLLDATDAGTDTIFCRSSVFIGGATTTLVYVDNYQNVLVDLCGFVSGDKGLCIANDITNFTVTFCQFSAGVVGINIDYNGALCAATSVETCVSILSTTSTFISAASDSGNITATGGGTITNNKIDDSAVGSVLSVGLSPLDERWLFIGNNNLITSDRVNPTGWGFYSDGDTVTQTVPALEANAIKFSVDGLGSTSESGYLPRVIRGTSELWDVSADDMLPITVGDSYVLRLAYTLTAKSANPTLLTTVVDIGTTGGVTIPIAETSISTPNSFPRKIIKTFPVFSLATFLANGAQILMYTDSGTLDIEERSIFIERISSGAS